MAFSDFFQKLKDRLSGAGQMARTPDFADTFDTTDQPPAALPIGRGITSAIGAPPSPDAVTSAVDPGDWRIRDKAAVLPGIQSSRLGYSPDMLPDNNGPAPALDMSAGDPLAPRNQQWFNKVKPYMDQAAGGDPIAQREAQAVISGTKINPTKMDRFKQIILPALAGMAQGGANGNGWSGLGGAIAGGLTGAINPQAGAAYRYKTFQQPQDEQMIARENMRVKMERDNQLAQAKAQQEGAAADLARARADVARRPALPRAWNTNQGLAMEGPNGVSIVPSTAPPERQYVVGGNLVTGSGKTTFSAPREEKGMSDADIQRAADAEVARNLDIQKKKEEFANTMRDSVYARMGVTPEEVALFAKGYPGKVPGVDASGKPLLDADKKPVMVNPPESEVKKYQNIAQRVNSAEGVLRKMTDEHGKTLQDKMTAEVVSRYHQSLGKPSQGRSNKGANVNELVRPRTSLPGMK